MRITHITITNLCGFESFETDLPAIALIQGKNGKGKTSLLESLKYAFGRGHDPALIHSDAEFGEVLLAFDDESAVKARASRKTNETTRGYRAPGAKRFTVSRIDIDRMANAISYDALAFMDFEPKKQVETLLSIMPITVEEAEIATAVGDAAEEAGAANIQPGMNGLEIVRAVEKTVYSARTDLNRAADTQEKYAVGLEAALPPAAESGDWSVEVDRLREEKQVLETSESNEVSRIKEEFQAEKARLATQCDAATRAVDDEIAAKIRALEQERAERNGALIRENSEAIDKLKDAANQRVTDLRLVNKPTLDKLTADLATAEERARAQQQAVGTKQAIDAARKESAQKRERSSVLTAALDRLAALKNTVASRLPIKNVVIEDGSLLDNKGVPFQKWNTATQINFCLRIAVLAHGPAGFICMDGAERFDSEKRAGLLTTAQKYAEREGLQFLIASVSDSELMVTEGVTK